MAGLNILGGFAKGFAQGQLLKVERERQKEKDKLTKQMLDLQLTKEKTNAAEKKAQMDFRNMLYNSPKFQKAFGITPAATEASASKYTTPAGPAGGTATGFGKSFTEGPAAASGGVTDMIALAEMNPLFMQLMDYASGGTIGFSKAQGTAMDQQRNRVLQQQGDERISVSRDRMERSDADRDRDFDYRKAKDAREYAPTGQTGKTADDRLLKPNELPLWINPDTLQRAKPGDTPRSMKRGGYIRVSPGQLEKVQKIEAVKRILSRVEVLMDMVIPREESIGRLGGVGRELSAATQVTKKGQTLAVLRDYVTGSRAMVAKALGEVGNLSETEQEAVTKMFGAIFDAGPKAWQQFELLKETFNDAKNTAFGRKTTGKKTTGKKGKSAGTADVDYIWNEETQQLEPAK